MEHRPDNMVSRPQFCLRVCGAIAAAMLAVPCARGAADIPADRLYELARPLSTPRPQNFIRRWLLCGEFPNPPLPGEKTYSHKPPCVGLDTDYLIEHGGEANIHPVEGMTHTRPDGSIATWIVYDSPGDIVNLEQIYKGQQRPTDNALAYAFTTVYQAQTGRVFLSVGSDDGVRVWVNGEMVHDHIVPRAAVPDQDMVAVDLTEGENRIMLKIENGNGRWGHCARVVPEIVALMDGTAYQPKIESKMGEVERLTVSIGPGVSGHGAGPTTVVDVLLPGGSVRGTTVLQGAGSVDFPVTHWDDGPYEVRCTQTSTLASTGTWYLPWFKGRATEAVSRLVAAANASEQTSHEGMVFRMLVTSVRHRIGAGSSDMYEVFSMSEVEFSDHFRNKAHHADLTKVHSALMESEELLRRLDGEPGGERPDGFVRLAYHDDVDDSAQFCRAYLPADYDPAQQYPLVVNLHGYRNDTPPYVEWDDNDLRHHPWAEKHGVIVIEPNGRYNSWYKWLGDDDVVRCIALAKEKLPVDPDRVCLTGYSMGGGGVWEVGCRHPELFAGLGPVCGGWDDRVFIDKGQRDKWTPRQRFAREVYSSFSCAESLMHVPVFINHGIDDKFVDMNHARLITRTMQRWGYQVRLWEHVKGTHDHKRLGHDEAMLHWFVQQRRVAPPSRVRLRASDLRSASAHWLRVLNWANPIAFVNAEAEIVASNCVRLNSDNVLAVALSPSADLVDLTKPLTLIWNGFLLRADFEGGVATFADPRGNTQPGNLAKTPAVAGPLRDVTTTPFAVVVGTISCDVRRRAFCEWRARRICDAWRETQHWMPRLYKDTDLGPEDMQRYSLILIGGPEDNLVTWKLLDRLPLAIQGSTIELHGTPLECPDSLLRMVYPHPLNPKRYVSVTAATSANALFYTAPARDVLGFRNLDNMDFYVIDGHVPDPAAGRPCETVCLASGFFGPDWGYSADLVTLGREDVRGRAPKQTVPPRVEPFTNGKTLFLSDLLDSYTSLGASDLVRDRNADYGELAIAKSKFKKGIGLNVWRLWGKKAMVEWNIADAGWHRLKGAVGIQLSSDKARLGKPQKDGTKVRFFVKVDGREVFKSDQLKWNSGPVAFDVDISGVRTIRLETINEGDSNAAAISANWGGLRLERAPPKTEGDKTVGK